MSTFGRGLRAEYKRLLFNNVDGINLKTFLTVPSNANYFIFINKILQQSMTSLGVYGPSTYSNTGGFHNSVFISDFVAEQDTREKKNVFMDFFGGSVSNYTGNNSQLQFVDGGVPYENRIIHPGFSLSGNGQGNPGFGAFAIYYQEIYFGGQLDY